jgi:GNAT superfamily N-acetyltransferase
MSAAHDNLKLELGSLTPDEFISLSKSVGWGTSRIYDMTKVALALKETSLTIVARDSSGLAVACGRAFSDDLLMTFIPDIFVHPSFQKSGCGRLILEKLKERYGHTVFFFGAQPGNEGFFEKLGFTKSVQSFTGKFKDNPYFSA